MEHFYRKRLFNFLSSIQLKPLEPLVGHRIARFAGIRITDTQTHKTTAVTLTAHAH